MKKIHIFMLIIGIFLIFILSGCGQDDTINIKVNQMECFSGKTKQEIYDIRKKYVAKSIFKSDNYEPSEEVFGQIEDGLPWRSIFTEVCLFNPISETKGFSEESRFINNPILLLGLRNGSGINVSDPINKDIKLDFCDGRVAWIFPDKITYSKNKKTITVYYNDLHILPTKFISYYIETINAQDFGYRYGKMIKNDAISFKNPNDNISTRIYEFQDFIHKGDSCGVEGGCNNCSPYIEGYEFSPLLNYFNKEKKTIEFKLWKTKPRNDDTEADMIYRIVFDYKNSSSEMKKDVLFNILPDHIKGNFYRRIYNVKSFLNCSFWVI